MDFKSYQQEMQKDLPPLVAHNDVFDSINAIVVKTIDYQGKPTEVGVLTTNRGTFGTFSGILIKQLRTYFENHKSEPLTNVRVEQPRGKKYLQLVPKE